MHTVHRIPFNSTLRLIYEGRGVRLIIITKTVVGSPCPRTTGSNYLPLILSVVAAESNFRIFSRMREEDTGAAWWSEFRLFSKSKRLSDVKPKVEAALTAAAKIKSACASA